jgi:hypothetical protein
MSKQVLEKPNFVSEDVDWSKETQEWKKSFIEIGKAIQEYSKQDQVYIEKFVVHNSGFTDYKIVITSAGMEYVEVLFEKLEKAGWKVHNFHIDLSYGKYTHIIMTIWV